MSLEAAVDAALRGEPNPTEKSLRSLLGAEAQPQQPEQTTTTAPSYGLNSDALTNDLAARLGPETTIDKEN